jgi:predicted permease
MSDLRSSLATLWFRLRTVFRRRALDRELHEELRFHRELLERDFASANLAPADARAAASRRLGSSLGVRERSGDWWGFPAVDSLIADLRFGVRSLGSRPALALTLLLTLTLGLGASIAAFGIIDGVLLRPLPVRDQARVVVMWRESAAAPAVHLGVPSAGVPGLAGSGRVFQSVAPVGLPGVQAYAARYQDRLLPVDAAMVGGNFFRVLGVTPALGRLLTPADDSAGSAPSVVLSYNVWLRDFGGDSSVIGRSLNFFNGPETIVGVAPPDFAIPTGAGIWASLKPLERMFPGRPGPDAGFASEIIGRLAPGATATQAQSQFARYIERYPSQSMGDSATRIARVQSLTDRVLGPVRPTLVVLTTAVALVLLIALTNAAGLLLTRALARRTELAVRAALGAGRMRLIRQLLTEHMLLAIVSGGLALSAAWGLLHAATALAPPTLLRFDSVHLDPRVLAFAAALTIVAVVLFGLTPAVVASRSTTARSLRSGSRTVAGHRGSDRVRGLIVATQVALCVIVLTTAGLLTRSLERLQHTDIGFAPDSLLVIGLEDMTPFDAHTQSWDVGAARYAAVLNDLATRLPRVHGMAGVTTVYSKPFSGSGLDMPYAIDGAPSRAASDAPKVAWDLGLESSFATLGIPIRRGRGFTAEDRRGSAPVAVVNQAFARLAWPGVDAIGRRVRLNPSDSAQPWRTIVGVVADARYRDLTRPPVPTVYVPVRQTDAAPMYLVMRTSGIDPREALAPFKRILRASNPDFGIRSVATGRDLLAAPLARPRFLATTLAALSGTALFLAAVGLYGLLTATVRERQRELAIRVALGATPAAVRTLVARRAAAIVVVGLVTGGAAAYLGMRMLRAALYGVSPTDPATFAAAILVILLVVGLATYAPAMRATRVNPTEVLGAE